MDTTEEGPADCRRAFFHEHRDLVIGLARRHLPDADAAEDVASSAWQSFLVAFDRIMATAADKGDPTYPVSALISIVRRRAADWYRNGTREWCIGDDGLNHYRDKLLHRSLSDHLSTVMAKVDLERAMDKLAPRERQVLLHHIVDQLPPEISAEQLKISRATFFRDLASAIDKLKRSRCLDGYGQQKEQKEGTK